METKTWQERFDEMSEIDEFWWLPYDHLVDKAVKQFISDIIAETREETIGEIKEKLNKVIKYNSEINEDYKYAYSDLVEEINKLKK